MSMLVKKLKNAIEHKEDFKNEKSNRNAKK